MRVALVVAGSRGDAEPFVALGRTLAGLGARPVLLTHAEHQDLARRSGVDFVALPGDPRAMLATPTGLALLTSRDPVRALRGLRDLAADLIDDVIAALETHLRDVDAVVFSTLAVAAHHVAERHGVPALWGVLQPVTPTRAWPSLLAAPPPVDLPGWANLASHRFADRLAWALLAPGLMAYRRRVGLPKFGASRVREEVVTLGGWSPLLAPAPPDWPPTVSVTGAWRIPVDATPPLPAEVLEFLDDGPPPVYVGLGSATVAQPEAVTEMLLGAADDAGVRVVLSQGWAGLGDSQPRRESRVLVVAGELSHQRLFPRCAAVVHHAGAGTTHTALAAGAVGVPLPLWADQPFWAARTAALGVSARPVAQHGWTRSRIAQAIAHATGEPWRRERARRGAEIEARTDGAAVAAARVIAAATARL